MAAADTVFMGWQADSVLRDHYRRAKALLFPGEEDFGIVPVEAQACGLPVIAYGVGGATETVLSNETGVLYTEQKESALVDAILVFERLALDAEFIRKNAVRFSKDRFTMEIKAFIQTKTVSFGLRP
jgi:glycosyltransferase involved in cell wall biosynthesis